MLHLDVFSAEANWNIVRVLSSNRVYGRHGNVSSTENHTNQNCLPPINLAHGLELCIINSIMVS